MTMPERQRRRCAENTTVVKPAESKTRRGSHTYNAWSVFGTSHTYYCGTYKLTVTCTRLLSLALAHIYLCFTSYPPYELIENSHLLRSGSVTLRPQPRKATVSTTSSIGWRRR